MLLFFVPQSRALLYGSPGGTFSGLQICSFHLSWFANLQFSPFVVCKFAVFTFSGLQICSFLLSWFPNLQFLYFPALQTCSLSTFLVCKFAVFRFSGLQICSFHTYLFLQICIFTKLLHKLMTWVLITCLANHVRSAARKWRRSSYCGAHIQVFLNVLRQNNLFQSK